MELFDLEVRFDSKLVYKLENNIIQYICSLFMHYDLNFQQNYRNYNNDYCNYLSMVSFARWNSLVEADKIFITPEGD